MSQILRVKTVKINYALTCLRFTSIINFEEQLPRTGVQVATKNENISQNNFCIASKVLNIQVAVQQGDPIRQPQKTFLATHYAVRWKEQSRQRCSPR